MHQKISLIKLVFRDDLKMNEVVSMALKASNGRFQGQRMDEALFKGWMKENWELALGYVQKAFMLLHS